jgi:serine/threonine-protein kinase
MRLDRADEARQAYDRCIDVSPAATSCLRDLSDLRTHDGDCAAAERLARQLTAVDGRAADWLQHLARAVFAQGDNAEGALSALEQKWNRLSEELRRIAEPQDRAHLAVAEGDFARAIAMIDEWERGVAGSADENAHAAPAIERMFLYLELGQDSDAAAGAAKYRRRAAAWTPQQFFDYSIVPAQVEYLAGTLTRMDFERQRDSWLGRSERDGRGTPALRWLEGYAVTAKSRADANAALATLPTAAPALKELVARDSEFEEILGNVFVLAGRNEDALTHLRRGARSCAAIESPMWHTQANLHLGEVLERLHDNAGACTAYQVVRNRWHRDKRSKSAREAMARMEVLGCRL